MASVFKREGKKGATWYIRYTDQGKEIKEKVGKERDGFTKSKAIKALQSRLGDKAQGKFNLPQTKSFPRFSRALQKYLDTNPTNKKPGSQERDRSSSIHLTKFFGNKRIDEINSFLIEKYKAKRKKELIVKYPDKEERDINFASINRELALMKHFYTYAIKWWEVQKNPVKGIKMFEEKAIKRYLEKHEIEALLSACEEVNNKDLRAIVVTAYLTGQRKKNILNLKKSDCDFRNGLIYFEDTKSGELIVPMNDELKEVLKEHIKKHPESFEYVFCDEYGKPYVDIRASFNKALGIAGIKNFRFHDLRHTFASQLAMSGVDLNTIQELGGWKTPQMVRRYAHLSPDHKRKAINVLNIQPYDEKTRNKMGTNLEVEK